MVPNLVKSLGNIQKYDSIFYFSEPLWLRNSIDGFTYLCNGYFWIRISELVLHLILKALCELRCFWTILSNVLEKYESKVKPHFWKVYGQVEDNKSRSLNDGLSLYQFSRLQFIFSLVMSSTKLICINLF